MTFEVGSAINYLTDSFLNLPIVFWVSKNPLYTALVVTFLILLVIMFVFRDVEAEESVTVMALRSSFWIFLLLLGVMMVHNRVLMQETSAAKRKGEYDNVFTPTMGKNHDNDYIPVAPGAIRQQNPNYQPNPYVDFNQRPNQQPNYQPYQQPNQQPNPAAI